MTKKLKFAIIALMPLAWLIGCASEPFRITPDVVTYDKATMDAAAAEMEGGSCPILTNTMMPDYEVMRDQSRIK